MGILQKIENGEIEKKSWWQMINFYRLTGLFLIWMSSWIFMMPFYIETTAPVFENLWGTIVAAFGIVKKVNVKIQQVPDLLSGIFSLALIIILQLRGIFSVIDDRVKQEDKKNNELLFVLLNIISIIVHTLFFTIMIKMFLFPDIGQSSVMESLKKDFAITIFMACCITGMILGAQSIAKLLMLLLLGVGIFKNISTVSSTFGIYGFIAILLAAIGFYLEFYAMGFNKEKFLLDMKFLSGKYESLLNQGNSEMKAIKTSAKKTIKAIKNPTKLLK